MAQRVNIEVLNKAAVDVTVQNSNAINIEVPTAPRDFVPRFTADRTEVNVGETVDFSATNAGFQYFWSIEDGSKFIFKTGKNVGHQYLNPGEFDVALTQADLIQQASGIQVKRKFINVNQLPFLLNRPFGAGATAAYSLRKLNSSATKAARVREDTGNVETDIGFVSGELDETALLKHCGSNNGFVTKWYDQSGNGNDASNSTASEQPQIVSSGSVVKDNGKPTLKFDANISLKTSLKFDYKVSVYVVANPLVSQNNINDDRYLFDQGVFDVGFGSRFRGTGLEHRTDSGDPNSNEVTISFINKQYFLSYLFAPSNSLLESQDNSKTFSIRATTIQGTDTLDIASSEFSISTKDIFYIQEEIFYDFDNIAERNKVRQNQQNFY